MSELGRLCRRIGLSWTTDAGKCAVGKKRLNVRDEDGSPVFGGSSRFDAGDISCDALFNEKC